VLLAVESSAM
jgi:hypothetical protein